MSLFQWPYVRIFASLIFVCIVVNLYYGIIIIDLSTTGYRKVLVRDERSEDTLNLSAGGDSDQKVKKTTSSSSSSSLSPSSLSLSPTSSLPLSSSPSSHSSPSSLSSQIQKTDETTTTIPTSKHPQLEEFFDYFHKKWNKKNRLESIKNQEKGNNLLKWVTNETKISMETFQIAPQNIKEYRLLRFEAYKRFNKLNISGGLGDWGTYASLGGKMRVLVDEIEKKEKFNKLLSDRISLDRRLKEFRDPACNSLSYDNDLAKASVIIIFCNEAPSIILRTVHSVVNRSPPEMLEEVLLVDDASDREDLKLELQGHLQTHFQDHIVNIIRSEERIGLIRARNLGASKALGSTLVFLDAHCEVTTQWLEPLLQRIKDNPTTVACPLIDLISSSNLMYSRNGGGSVGGFNWDLNFDWQPIPRRILRQRSKSTDPYSTPAMAGGLFAMGKSFYFHLGGYDEGMKIWGSENTEMSIRVWTCGGRIEMLPCSRVGHLYRSTFPYKTDGQDLSTNSIRVAEVWLDEYKELFYFYRPELKRKRIKSIQARVDLRKNLRCHPFNWFLKEVYPELFIPNQNMRAYGAICNTLAGQCWDSGGDQSDYGGYSIRLKPFHGKLNQLFSLDREGSVRKDERCLCKSRSGGLKMEVCSHKGKVQVLYSETNGMMRVLIKKEATSPDVENKTKKNSEKQKINEKNEKKGLVSEGTLERCLEVFLKGNNGGGGGGFYLFLSNDCNIKNLYQKWTFKKII